MQKSDNHLDADMTMIRILEIDIIVEQIKSPQREALKSLVVDIG